MEDSMPRKKASESEQTVEQKTVSPTTPPRWIRSPDFKTIYTNFVQSGYTAFDISLVLAETAGVDEMNAFVIESKARVVMSPVEAKVVLAILSNTINKFEEQFGPINISPATFAPASAASDKTEGV
jgi:hypothetical protein